jgi:hypothetical protein
MIYRKLISSVVCLASALACSESSDDDGSSAGACPYDYSKFDGTTPEVSFSQDVLSPQGMFRTSCAFNTTCHGNPTINEANLYLGADGRDAGALTQDDINLIYGNLVDKPAEAAPNATALRRVVAGQPENSFLMFKLDGCLDQIKDQCSLAPNQSRSGDGHPCGDLMPQGGEILPEAERNVIRAWIKQGAKNN